MKQKKVEYRIEVKGADTESKKLEKLEIILKSLRNNPGLISNSKEREDIEAGIRFLSKELEIINREIYKVADSSANANHQIQAIATDSETNIQKFKDGLFDLANTLPIKLGDVWVAMEDVVYSGLDELSSYTNQGLIGRRANLIEAYLSLEKDVANEISRIEEDKNAELAKQNAHRAAIEEKKEKERRQEQLKGEIFHHENFIKQRESQVGEIWKYLEIGQEVYRKYFKAKRELYKENNDELRETLTEENEYRLEVEKFYQERKRASLEEQFKEDKVALKNQLAEGVANFTSTSS